MNLKALVPSLQGVLKLVVAMAVINSIGKRVAIVKRITDGF